MSNIQISHESLFLSSMRTGDLRQIQETLESCTFLPYDDEIATQAILDFETEDLLIIQSPALNNTDGRRHKASCIIESIQLLLGLIIDPPDMLELPPAAPDEGVTTTLEELVANFFEKIDLRYCVPTLRGNYNENTLYYACFIHELCVERKCDTLRVMFNALPLDARRRELQRHDYLSIESRRTVAAAGAGEDGDNQQEVHPNMVLGNQAGEEEELHHQDEEDHLNDDDPWRPGQPQERVCTPLQAAWEKILIDHPLPLILDRLDSITRLSDLYLNTNHEIKDLIETSVLVLRAYEDIASTSTSRPALHHSSHHLSSADGDDTSSSSVVAIAGGNTGGGAVVVPGEEEQQRQQSPPAGGAAALFFDRITHVLIRLGHSGGGAHAALFRFILRLCPQSLDIRDDEGNLPIHLLSSSTIFYFSRKRTRSAAIRRRRRARRRTRYSSSRGAEEHHKQQEGHHGHQHGWDMPPILMVLESRPEHATIPDENNNLPLHIFLLSFRENYGRKETLRDVFRNNLLMDDGAGMVLFLEEQQWNHGERRTEASGRLIFPYQQDIFSVLRSLVISNAQSLSQVDGSYGLYPFMVAASSVSGAPLDFIFYLLCADPTILSFDANNK